MAKKLDFENNPFGYKLNKDGYFRTTFTIQDSNGNKKRVPLRDKNPYTLKEKLDRAKLEYEMGLMIVNENSTVEKWALEWLETYKKGKIGEGAYMDCVQKVNQVIKEIGNLKLSEIRQHRLQAILNKQNKSKSNARKLKNVIEQIFKTAMVNELIPKNPAIGLQLPDLKDGKRRSITKDEQKLILKIAETHRAGLWLKIMLYCGLRPSEAVALKWNDIDFENKKIDVNKALEIRNNKIGPPKTAAGYRKVPIPQILFKELECLYATATDDLLFTQPTTGKHHTGESMRCMWENFVREANIQMGAKIYRNRIKKEDELFPRDITPYCFRHTYCTDLQNAGVPINVAKYFMGHSDIRVTANIYTHQSDVVSDAAAQAIERYLSDNSVPNRKFKLYKP